MFGFKDVTEFAGFLKGVVSEVPPEQWQALLRAIATDTMAETRVRFGMADDVHLIPCGDSPVPPLNPAPS